MNLPRKIPSFNLVILIIAFVNILWGVETVGITTHLHAYLDIQASSKPLHSLSLYETTHRVSNLSFFLSLLGILISGLLTDLIGRRLTLQLANIIFLITIGIYLITSNTQLDIICVAMLKFSGNAIIIASVCLIAELAPAKFRNRSVGLIKLFGMFGMLLAYLSNYGIPLLFNDFVDVRFSIMLFISGLSMLALFFAPESPRWLCQVKGKRNRALAILKSMHQVTEINSTEIKSILALPQQPWKTSLQLFTPPYLRITVLVSLMTFLIVSTGIGNFLAKAPDIFQNSGIEEHYKIILMSVCLIITYGIGILISLLIIDRLGIKKLVVFSLGSMIVSYLILSIASNLTLGNQLQYSILLARPFILVFLYSLGCTAAFTLILTIFFPTPLRGRGVALTSIIVLFVHHYFNKFLLIINDILGLNGLYWISTVIAILLLIVCLEALPDNSRLILEQEKLN